MTDDTRPSEERPEQYRFYSYTYGKLKYGNNFTNKIVKGSEHSMTGCSAELGPNGHLAELQNLCAPNEFIGNWTGIKSVDARTLKTGGAFMYRPAYFGRQHYGVFVRLEARSEEGDDSPGRLYTHCAALLVPDRWDPSLIILAAQLLYGTHQLPNESEPRWLGEPNYEKQTGREKSEKTKKPEGPVILTDPIYRTRLAELPQAETETFLRDLGEGRLIARGQAPSVDALQSGVHPMVDLAKGIAWFLGRETEYAVHGRWLPFAIGIKTGVEGTGDGFSLVYDNRGADVPPSDIKLGFSDASGHAPHVHKYVFSGTNICWEKSLKPRSGRAASTLRPSNFWDDQLPLAELDGYSEVEAEERTRLNPDATFIYNQQPDVDAQPEPLGQEPETGDALETLEGMPLDLSHKEFIDAINIDRMHGVKSYFVAKIGGLNEYVRKYQSDRYEPLLTKQFEEMVRISLIASLYEDPSYWQAEFVRFLQCPEFPFYRLDPGDRGSVLGYFFAHYLTHLGKAPLETWLDRECNFLRERFGPNYNRHQGRPYYLELIHLLEWFQEFYDYVPSGRGHFDPDRDEHHRELFMAWKAEIQSGAIRLRSDLLASTRETSSVLTEQDLDEERSPALKRFLRAPRSIFGDDR